MSDLVPTMQAVIGIEEHAWTHELRDALLKYGDDTVTMMSSQPDIDRRVLDVGDERLARMDAAGVDLEVLSITTPGTQPLPPAEAVPLARDANDFLADAVRRPPDRFAAFGTLATPVPDAAAEERERCVTRLETYLDHDKFRPVFEAAAELAVPLYIHPALPPRAVRDASYSGFSDFTDMILSAGGWGVARGRGSCGAPAHAGGHVRPSSGPAGHPGALGRDARAVRRPSRPAERGEPAA